MLKIKTKEAGSWLIGADYSQPSFVVVGGTCCNYRNIRRRVAFCSLGNQKVCGIQTEACLFDGILARSSHRRDARRVKG